MEKCIFCLRPFDSDVQRSKEHVFPNALGGGPLYFHDVCKACNSNLGRFVDTGLVNNFFMDLKRHELGLSGYGGKVPNPFGIGESVEAPGLRVLFEPGRGEQPNKLRVQKGLTRKVLEDGTEVYSLTFPGDDIGAAEAEIRKIEERARKRGLVPMPREEMRITRRKNPPLQFERDFDPLGHLPGMLKIAYELSYLVHGPAYLDDPIAEKLRGFLTLNREWGEKDLPQLRGEDRIGDNHMPFDFMNGSVLSGHVHTDIAAGGTFVAINVLGMFFIGIQTSESSFGKQAHNSEIFRIDPTTKEYMRVGLGEWLMAQEEQALASGRELDGEN